MKKLLTIFLIFAFCKLAAQTDTAKSKPIITAYNPKGNYQTFDIKAALIPWTLGNAGGIFLSLGADYSFFKNHSIGIEATLYGDQGNHDSYTYTNNSVTVPAQSYKGANKAIYLNYRYYFNFQNIRQKTGLIFYIGAFGRMGTANYKWTAGYTYDSITSSKKTYYSYGALAGASIKLKHRKYIGFDFNVGTLYNNKTVGEVYQKYPTQLHTNVQFASYDLRLSVSVCWWFYHPKKIKQ
ncbi:MAG: hypothetical protein ACHQII_02600 [Bacteroidia bacterium]